MRTKQKQSADVRQHISAAVEELSKMAAAQVQASAPTNYQTAAPSARMYLWIGVSVLTAAILGLWLVNIKSLFQDIKTAPKTAERRFLEDARADVSAAIKNARITATPSDSAVAAALRESLLPR